MKKIKRPFEQPGTQAIDTSISVDQRVDASGTDVRGISPEIDRLINERFRSLTSAILQLQDRTLLEPQTVPPERLYDGLVVFADGVNWSPDATGNPGLYYYSDGAWHPLLDEKHVALTPPLYEDNPHWQYWHKELDPAWAHMFYQSVESPLVLNQGDTIQGYTSNALYDWQLTSDLANGTIVVDSSGGYSEVGTYQMSISGYADGANNADYVITLYANGAPTAARLLYRVPGNATSFTLSWSGVVHIGEISTLDLRLEIATAALSLPVINWSMHRISPVAGTTGIGPSVTATTEFMNPPPIPDGWGDPGMP